MVAKDSSKEKKVIVTNIWRYTGNIDIKSPDNNQKYDFDIKTEDFANAIEVEDFDIKLFVKPRKSWFVAGMFLLALHTLLPNKETTIYCASAYLVQTVLTDERTQELGSAAYNATLTQLKEWSKQSDEVSKLISPVLEKAINEKVTNNNEAK